tara:strand:- start:202 stop:480 length:279 start_codon:yes stop_codon:yes gene_type:complete
MIDNTMRNTFGVLTNRCSISDILDQYEGEDAMFYGNPLSITDEEIKDMIQYFENTEEYEYCAELKELLTAKNFADLDMLLDKLAEENGVTLQ